MEIKKDKIFRQDLDLDVTYKLSALINVDSFFYGLLDEKNSFCQINEIPLSHASMSYIGSGHSLKIEKTCLGIFTNQFTIIPASEYSKQEEGFILEEAVQPNANFGLVINSDYLKLIDAYLIYGLPRYIHDHCNSHFTDSNFSHVVASIINDLTSKNPETLIHVSSIGDETIFICFKNGALKMANIYKKIQPMTLLYYVKLVEDSFGISKDQLQVEYSGAYSHEDASIGLLKKYYKNISNHDIGLPFSRIDSDQASLLFPLHSIAQCA